MHIHSYIYKFWKYFWLSVANHIFRVCNFVAFQSGLSEPRGPWSPPPLILTDQLALYQPDRGGNLCPSNCYYPPPRIFRPSYGFAVSMTHCIIHQTTCFWGHLPETRLFSKTILFLYIYFKTSLNWLYILHLFRHDYFQVPLGNYNLF